MENELNINEMRNYTQFQMNKNLNKKEAIYNFKHNQEIEIGNILYYGVGTHKFIIGPVTEIIEKRKARGVYEDESKRPNLYSCKVDISKKQLVEKLV